MKILAKHRLAAAESADNLFDDSVDVEAAQRKYKKKRMSEMSESSLRRIANSKDDPRKAMATRELKHRAAVNKRNVKQGQSKSRSAAKPSTKLM